MRVEVHLLEQSQPIVILDVHNAYTKGPLYCVRQNDMTVSKFPTQHVFRIREIPE